MRSPIKCSSRLGVAMDSSDWTGPHRLQQLFVARQLLGAEIHNISRIVPEFQIRSAGDDVWMEQKHKYRGQARMVVARLDSERALVFVSPQNPEPSIDTYRG